MRWSGVSYFVYGLTISCVGYFLVSHWQQGKIDFVSTSWLSVVFAKGRTSHSCTRWTTANKRATCEFEISSQPCTQCDHTTTEEVEASKPGNDWSCQGRTCLLDMHPQHLLSNRSWQTLWNVGRNNMHFEIYNSLVSKLKSYSLCPRLKVSQSLFAEHQHSAKIPSRVRSSIQSVGCFSAQSFTLFYSESLLVKASGLGNPDGCPSSSASSCSLLVHGIDLAE